MKDDFTWPWFYPLFYFVGTLWFTGVAVLSVVAVGYESQPISTPNFNGTTTLWYERFIPPTPWISKAKVCQGEKIDVDDC